MKPIVYILCVFTFLISSSCDENDIEGDESEDSTALTEEGFIEMILASLNDNSNLEVRDLSSFEIDPDLIAFPDRDPIINEDGVLSLGLGYVENESLVNGIGFSIGDDTNAYVLFPTIQVGDAPNTLSMEVELRLDNCEFIRDLCDIIPIRFFAIKADGTVSVSFTDHINFSCSECPITYKDTAWGNFFFDALEYSNVDELLSFAVSGQQEFLITQSIGTDYFQVPDEPQFQLYPGTEISAINNVNTIQCYEQGEYHVIRVKRGNALVLFYTPIGGLNHNVNIYDCTEDYELTTAGTQVGSLISGPTVMLYELDKPPGSNWWLIDEDEYSNGGVECFTWYSSEEDIFDPKPYHDPFRAKHYLRFDASLTEHRPFLGPRTYTDPLLGEQEYIRRGDLYLNAYLTCRHL